MDKALDEYREAHIGKAIALEKKGLSFREIAESMGITIETVEVLLDHEAIKRVKKNEELEQERKNMLTKALDDMRETIRYFT